MSACAPIDKAIRSADTVPMAIRHPEIRDGRLADLVCRFGGPAGNILLDPECWHFEQPGIRGLIGFKQFGRCAIVLGDPVCAPEDSVPLIEAFRRHCRTRGWSCIHVVIGARMAAYFRAQGIGLIEFGTEQVLDLRRNPAAEGYIRDLRKKLKRARNAGLEIREYRPELGLDGELESQMADVARVWLKHRAGPQTYWSGIDLFRARRITRWFYGTVDEKVVGVLSMLRLEGREGYLMENILWRPEAPVGTSELLIAQSTEKLAEEGIGCASFGPSPAMDLGEVSGFSRLTGQACRLIYRGCLRFFHLNSKLLYRQKFRPACAQPLYLAFDAQGFRPGALLALPRTFNFSIA